MLLKYTFYLMIITLYIFWTYSSLREGYYYFKKYKHPLQSELFDSWCLVHIIALALMVFVKIFTIWTA